MTTPFAVGAFPQRVRQHKPVTTAAIRFATRSAPLALLAAIVAAGFAGVGGNAVRYAFTAAAFLAGLVYYFAAPRAYLGYSLGMWFFNPMLRRMVDMHLGYTDVNVMSLAPLLVSGIAIVAVLRYLPALIRRSRAPFFLMGAALLYGLGLGLFTIGVQAAMYTFATWVIPLLFGMSIVLRWREYPELRDDVLLVMPWMVLATGLYGVFQWIHPFSWDVAWMLASRMSSIGLPLPYQVRVFSTLNAPGPFGACIGAGLLALLARRSRLALLAGPVGAVAFLLSLNRTAWIACVLAAIAYACSLRGRARVRLAIAGGTLVLAVAGLLIIVPLAPEGKATDTITMRFNTLTDLSNDRSLNAREANFPFFVDAIIRKPLGHGLGSTGTGTALGSQAREEGVHDFDNGILETFYSLGWFAGTCWWLGVLLLFARNILPASPPGDQFASAARAVALFCIAAAPSTNPFVTVSGTLLWLFLGLSSASRDYVTAPFGGQYRHGD